MGPGSLIKSASQRGHRLRYWWNFRRSWKGDEGGSLWAEVIQELIGFFSTALLGTSMEPKNWYIVNVSQGIYCNGKLVLWAPRWFGDSNRGTPIK